MAVLPVDHIVFLVPHIDDYVEEFARVTGVTPLFGGAHAKMGTKNFLVRLDFGNDNPSYLELLGLDDAQQGIRAEDTVFGVGKYGPDPYPHLFTWAIHPGDLGAVTGAATRRGVQVGDVREWSRESPEGELLEWRVAFNSELPFGGLQPFLIDWGNTPHPSFNTALETLSVVELRLEHPSPEQLSQALSGLGLQVIPPISFGLVPTIFLTVDTPRGQISLH
ncbi:Glyoxalase-like domain-containing protein [Propionibacterium cyclohexanicum]|uniref:Glyoxalase-like domain-containing protein n=1 Tax=Propionibacterium cyclohexanicum TaxID=64702 RepID=A0A1H9RYJ4_9ACTN|nr:VOC family protein [Propionibacterium cyclohexanicum]SER77870.1 Glyoxalase-like domain-containing protein [Propionibacterium cyclohexanicum]